MHNRQIQGCFKQINPCYYIKVGSKICCICLHFSHSQACNRSNLECDHKDGHIKKFQCSCTCCAWKLKEQLQIQSEIQSQREERTRSKKGRKSQTSRWIYQLKRKEGQKEQIKVQLWLPSRIIMHEEDH